MDAKWDATLDNRDLEEITRPDGITLVIDAVGLLNIYEYQSCNNGKASGYLNNGDWGWTLTPYSTSVVYTVFSNGNIYNNAVSNVYGVRPSINLKSSVKIVDGDGTVDNPYRLNGDKDTNLSGTLLNIRYSGEYIRFGVGENTLYRIVSHETEGLTKITSAEPLKSEGSFITSAFDSNGSTNYSASTTIGTFLNGTYLTDYVESTYSSMITDSTTWYLGTVGSVVNYKLAKYTDTGMSNLTSSTSNSTVGLLRLGELMSGQFDKASNNTNYWTLTPYSASIVRNVNSNSDSNSNSPSNTYAIKPAFSLKSNVIITNGTGTLNDPFNISLAN